MPDAPFGGGRWPVATPVAPAPAVEVEVRDNPWGLAPDELFGVARRRNARRSALFVSTVLGKHVPAPPADVAWAGLALARRVAHRLDPSVVERQSGRRALVGQRDELRAWRVDPADVGPVTVLGYAETAVALGHLVGEGLAGARVAQTTRLVVPGCPEVAAFEEEHSHATSHRVLHHDPAVLDDGAPLVLVDDELTTGRTVRNTIEALHQRHPRSRYLVACLLDWRGREDRAAFDELADRLGVALDVVSLLAGEVGGVIDDVAPPPGPAPRDAGDGVGDATHRGTVVRCALAAASGRTGWDPAEQEALEAVLPAAAGAIAARVGGPRVLCLGTEELMYVPLRIAEALAASTPELDVRYQSTTRSPIVAADAIGYPVRHARAFSHPGDPDRPSFVYNVPPGAYDDIVVFVEGDAAAAAAGSLRAGLEGAAPAVHLVALTDGDPPTAPVAGVRTAASAGRTAS